MRRARSLLVAGAASIVLLAAVPGSASAWPLSDAVNCTSSAQRQWDPSSVPSTQQFVTRVHGCWMAYAQFFASPSHQEEFVLCMDRAVDAYKPPTYIEYTLGITIYCVENYLGYDISISPRLTTGEPPPAGKRVKRQRRLTRSHRRTRS